ncbi:Detected protein of unknown function [Hibiscus syriacus]|uniref:Uncharacterized protein n=1 Tax=Hibiscus syriacus TaxID=106335 RepID=A0A6A2XSY3_HIBSY|nr:uncharacterized protein LOC120187496 isoform X2 [Hibiscus syriacus]KAE8661529.1 Detected protein of unknown function [Hibiscus syriacus]
MRSMVCSGDRETEMGPPRSKPLHNFDLPCLKWGNRRYLTCKKLDDASNATATAASGVTDQYQHCRRRGFVQRRRSPPSKVESLVVGGMRRRESESSSPSSKNTDCAREQRLRIPKGEPVAAGIEAVREKIMKDLKTVADEIKVAIFRDEVSGDDDADDDDEEFKEPKNKQKLEEKEREESPAVEVEQRPWNLRTRRAACKAPIDGEVTNYNYSSPMKNDVFRSPRIRDNGPSSASASAAADKKRPRPKFSVALSKKEIEEDFMAMVGHHRPPRRPKKRTRNVQKQLDYLFPGLWLTEVTVDSYKVPELVENGKM